MIRHTCFGGREDKLGTPRYTNYGEGPSGIVFVHGWTCDASFWQAQIGALQARHRVLTIDLPGHAKSELPSGKTVTIDLFADAVESVLADAQVERAVLAGHSMGALVVQRYAQMFPARAAALIFIDGLLLRPSSVPGFARFLDQLRPPDNLAAREKYVRAMLSPATTPELTEHILRVMLSVSPETAYRTFAAMVEPSLHEPPVSQLPALAIYQENSPAGDGWFLKQRYPDLEYHRIPGTGHFLMMEKPAEVNRLLLDFISRRGIRPSFKGGGGGE